VGGIICAIRRGLGSQVTLDRAIGLAEETTLPLRKRLVRFVEQPQKQAGACAIPPEGGRE
jgi:hypothetical protein